MTRFRVPQPQLAFLFAGFIALMATLTFRAQISIAQALASSSANANIATLGDPRTDAFSFDVWRNERRIIDLHQHIEANPERFKREIGILDRSGVGIGVILGAGTVTAKKTGRHRISKKQRQWPTRCIPVAS